MRTISLRGFLQCSTFLTAALAVAGIVSEFVTAKNATTGARVAPLVASTISIINPIDGSIVDANQNSFSVTVINTNTNDSVDGILIDNTTGDTYFPTSISGPTQVQGGLQWVLIFNNEGSIFSGDSLWMYAYDSAGDDASANYTQR